jgi:hypothetical protein
VVEHILGLVLRHARPSLQLRGAAAATKKPEPSPLALQLQQRYVDLDARGRATEPGVLD